MTSRERVFAAVAHQEPDRVPYNLRPSPELVEMLRAEQNDPALDFDDFFKHDIRYVRLSIPEPPDGVPEWEWTPAPTEEEITRCTNRVKTLKEHDVVVCAGYVCGVFEHAKEWLGDEQTLTLPFDDPVRLEAILDRITEWKMSLYGGYVKSGVDIVWIGDDLGTQKSLVMSPEQYRKWYKPRHLRIIRHLRAIEPDVLVAFHCCGFVTTLIPDLIDIGVDIQEAVQAECMDLRELKREFGEDLTFWGGVGTQSVMHKDTREGVIEGVKRTLEIMAPGGGYIAAPCHDLTEEVPLENAKAYYEALELFGSYPIEL